MWFCGRASTPGPPRGPPRPFVGPGVRLASVRVGRAEASVPAKVGARRVRSRRRESLPACPVASTKNATRAHKSHRRASIRIPPVLGVVPVGFLAVLCSSLLFPTSTGPRQVRDEVRGRPLSSLASSSRTPPVTPPLAVPADRHPPRLVSFGSSKIASWAGEESRIGFGRSFSRKVWGEVLGWECDHNRLDRERKPGRSIGSGRGLEDGSRGVVWSAKVATT